MKRILSITFFILLTINNMNAGFLVGAFANLPRTYSYRYLYSVDENGMKTNENIEDRYYTINPAKKICFRVDEKEYAINSMYYKYIKSQDGISTYKLTYDSESDNTDNPYMQAYNRGRNTGKRIAYDILIDTYGEEYILFNANFTRMNISGKNGVMHVFEKITPQNKEKAPNKLW